MAYLYEPALNVGLGLLELLALVLIAALFSRRMPDLRTVGLVLAILGVAHLALFVISLHNTPLHWNWIGKALSILVTLAAIAVIPSIGWRNAGFTWNQHGGLGAAAIAAVLMCAFGWATNLLFAGAHFRMPDLESLLYQATMPGLNEEPLYRGVALFLLDRAFADTKTTLFGARLGFGAAITSVWFGLIHGNGIANGHFQIAMLPIVIIAIIGFFLAWIRERTQSIAVCVAGHNVLNLGQQFF